MPEPLRCSICNQPILPGETFDQLEEEPYHDDARHCIAAVVRRCAEIAKSKANLCGGGRFRACWTIEGAIRAEFPESNHD